MVQQPTVGAWIGNYKVLAELGAGGMGRVYLVEHPQLRRRAAAKLLRPDLARGHESSVLARFVNEAKVIAELDHPNVVSIIDFGTLSGGAPYILMELLDGESLAARLHRVGRLSVETTVEIALAVCAAIGAAHARGIVHRDLKPENIFLARTGALHDLVKVLDFGIAKVFDQEASKLTMTGAIVGTPAYMSPEQCDGSGDVDPRSDVYSLGVCLYHMLCGRPPFVAESLGRLLAMQLRDEPPPLSLHVPDLPPELEREILRALAKRREERHPTMDALRLALLGAAPSTITHAALPATLRFELEEATAPTAIRPSTELDGPSLVSIASQLAAMGAPFAALTERLQACEAPIDQLLWLQAVVETALRFGAAIAIAIERGAPAARSVERDERRKRIAERPTLRLLALEIIAMQRRVDLPAGLSQLASAFPRDLQVHKLAGEITDLVQGCGRMLELAELSQSAVDALVRRTGPLLALTLDALRRVLDRCPLVWRSEAGAWELSRVDVDAPSWPTAGTYALALTDGGWVELGATLAALDGREPRLIGFHQGRARGQLRWWATTSARARSIALPEGLDLDATFWSPSSPAHPIERALLLETPRREVYGLASSQAVPIGLLPLPLARAWIAREKLGAAGSAAVRVAYVDLALDVLLRLALFESLASSPTGARELERWIFARGGKLAFFGELERRAGAGSILAGALVNPVRAPAVFELVDLVQLLKHVAGPIARETSALAHAEALLRALLAALPWEDAATFVGRTPNGIGVRLLGPAPSAATPDEVRGLRPGEVAALADGRRTSLWPFVLATGRHVRGAGVALLSRWEGEKSPFGASYRGLTIAGALEHLATEWFEDDDHPQGYGVHRLCPEVQA